jgi:hypothetical protein
MLVRQQSLLQLARWTSFHLLLRAANGLELAHKDSLTDMFYPFKHRLTAGNEKLALDCNLKEKPAFTKDPYVPNGFLIPSLRGPAMQFSRASLGTFVDSDGSIKYAAENLTNNSEDITPWTKTRTTAAYNATTAPNGELTADKIIEDSTAANTHYARVSMGAAALTGRACNMSCYLKAAGRSMALVGTVGAINPANIATFDLVNGVVLSQGASVLASGIVDAGNGWWRCWLSYLAAPDYLMDVGLHNGVSNSYNGDGTSGVYLWGIQVSRGTTLHPYMPSAVGGGVFGPRYDHDPITGACKGLLYEETRTNLITNSTLFLANGGTNWSIGPGLTVLENSEVAPDGTLAADVWTTSVVSNYHYRQRTTSASTQTYSVFVKPLGAGITFKLGYALSGANGSTFSLAGAGSVTANDAGYAGGIEKHANGWYRVWITFTNSSFVYETITLVDIGAYALWGAQLEVGAFPTSYIPTTTATATRSRDYLGVYRENFRRDNLIVAGGNMVASPWSFAGSSLYAAVADPFGGNAGQEVLFSNTGDIVSGGGAHTIGAAHTASVYLKKGTSNWLRVTFKTSTGLSVNAYVDFTGSGVLGSYNTANGTLVKPPTFESVGDGWYRLAITATFTGGSVCYIDYRAVIGNNEITRATSARFCLYGAQLENGTEATDFIPANIIPQSQAFDAADWSPAGTRNFTVAADTAEAMAPNGTQTADKCTVGATTTVYQCVQNVGFTAGVPYCFSFYVNGGDFPQFSAWAGSPGTWPVDIIFNLSGAGSVASSTGAAGTILAVGNGWYRCSVTAVALATSTTTLRLSPARSGSRTVVGNSTDKFYLWGAMMSYGSTAPTYVQTATTAAAFAFDKLYNPAAGTLTWEGDLLVPAGAFGNRSIVGFANGASYTGHWVIFKQTAAPMIQHSTSVNLGWPGNDPFKVAISMSGTTATRSFNGGAHATSATPTPITPTQFLLADPANADAGWPTGHISRIRYYKKRLSGPRLQSLTNL